MYNLLCFSVDWGGKVIEIPRARIFEYTDKFISEKFYSNSELNLDALKQLPCIFCNEGTEDEDVYIGSIYRAEIIGNSVLLELNIDSSVRYLKNKVLYDNRQSLCMTDFEFSRNHWAVKNVDLYRFLLKYSSSRRPSPTVFNISPFEKVEQKLIALMMPFDTGFNAVRDAVYSVAKELDLECKRADDIWEHSSIIQDIVSLIDRSRVVICDCTGKNPNVFYEAGIAHTLGREVVIIAQNDLDVPFDLRHLRYIKYLNNTQGLGELSSQIKNRIQTILGG